MTFGSRATLTPGSRPGERTLTRICHVFPTFAAGGPQVRVAQIINSLPGTYRHTILAIDGDTSARSRLRPSVDVEFADVPQSRFKFAHTFRLGRYLHRLNADLLITQNWGALDAMMSTPIGSRLPWIHMETGFNLDEAHGFKKRRMLARRVIFNRASAIVVPSQTLATIAQTLWGVSPSQIHYIPNGVDVRHFRPDTDDSFRKSLGIERDDVVIGTVANLRPVKDPLRLLEAFASAADRFPKARLVYVGDGSMRHRLEARIGELGLRQRVRVLGHMDDVSGAHRCFDVFALSSQSEQCPVSVLEAMATGRPVLSTDVGDVKAMLCAENRPFVTQNDDATAYRNALWKLVADEELRASIGVENRLRAENLFTVEAMTDAYRALYERALAATPATPLSSST